MRKILLFIIMLFCVCTTQAQQSQKDVTTFLGIPVDGFKSQMREKLIAKGFTPVKGQEYLKGEFNGTNVIVRIVTNNNKVYRIYLADENSLDEANIKIRYNNLVRQFEKNQRYISTSDFSISDSENISYEMICNKKTYDAIYYQKSKTEDGDASKKPVWFRIVESFGKYFIAMFYDNEYNHADGEDL